ncbi:TetR/AcrR family transcriptional regulator [Streptomyces cylindrosporus]|uniref:TetR/AcrR family transcriptional regulator n=1 Tax=Streptomyces cylindrosporus TaxID=2927583 RepID=A0ABS9YHU1_9ACTN|nr:TetR/AcrR family transcriptional regulator [Streptomyces cylindrosporus]MCI3276799.1 TetR/AcrR family transcriptional regulator [Streptomyces cylindrosporus]
MSGAATPGTEGNEPARQKRRYDSALRQERATRTRERIVAAGSELVHGFPVWDWRELTFRAVAEAAGVGERTVYRHFPTERALHGAVMRRLEEEAGVSYDGVGLDDIAGITERSFATLSSFAVPRFSAPDPEEPSLAAQDQRRRDALLGALAPHTADWSEEQRQMAAAILDVLWNVPSYERLMSKWGFDGARSTRAITWAMNLLTEAIREGHRPEEGPAEESPEAPGGG